MLFALALVLALQPAPTPQVTIPIRLGPKLVLPREVLTSATVSIPTIGAVHADTVKMYSDHATVSARPGKWNAKLRAASGRQRFSSATITSATRRYTLHAVSISAYQGPTSDQAVPAVTFTLNFTTAERH